MVDDEVVLVLVDVVDVSLPGATDVVVEVVEVDVEVEVVLVEVVDGAAVDDVVEVEVVDELTAGAVVARGDGTVEVGVGDGGVGVNVVGVNVVGVGGVGVDVVGGVVLLVVGVTVDVVVAFVDGAVVAWVGGVVVESTTTGSPSLSRAPSTPVLSLLSLFADESSSANKSGSLVWSPSSSVTELPALSGELATKTVSVPRPHAVARRAKANRIAIWRNAGIGKYSA